jgi:hypothetical protein
MRLLQPLLSPTPPKQALAASWQAISGHVRTARLRSGVRFRFLLRGLCYPTPNHNSPSRAEVFCCATKRIADVD